MAIIKRVLFFLAVILSNSGVTSAQVPEFDWAFGYGQTVSRKIITDNSRNIYSFGYIIGSPDMDPGPGTSIATSVGQHDIFISKFDPDGNLIWYKTMGGVDSERILDVKFNNQGELVMTGYFNLSVDMDPSSNTFILTSVGNYDIFILKMDVNGNFLGATSFGGTGNEESFALDIDSNDDIIITGYFSNTADFDPSSSNSFLSASGRDIFVSRYTTNFNFLWAKAFSNSTPSLGGFYNRGYDLVIDNQSNIHIVGEFAGTVDFDPEASVFNLTSSPLPAVSPDINTFYVKLASTGQLVNAHKILALNPVLTKDSNDDLIIGGNFASTNSDFDFGIGVQNIINSPLTSTYYLLKFTNTGTFIWVKGLGANANSIRPSISTDNSNSVYFTSNFTNTSDFDPSTNIFNLTSTGSSNVFITKLDLNGEFLWALSYGSTSGSGITDVNSMVLDNQSAIISTGSYGTSADMDPSNSVFNLTGGGNYYQKLYVCNNTNSLLDINQCNSYTAPDGVTYNTSGTYTATIPNAAGCDSIITINLTINQPTSSTITPEVCGSYTAPDGQIYTVGGNYTAIIPNVVGCDSTISINLSILPLPTINAGLDQTICEGTTVTLIASGGIVYSWDNDVVNGVPFAPLSTLTYTVTGTNASGCTNTDEVTVTVNPLPVVSFDADQLTGCVPLTVSFSSTTPDGQVCSWDFGNGMTSSDCAPSITYSDEGCFDVSLTVSNSFGCSSNAIMNDAVCATPEPVAGFITTTVSITNNQSVTFTNTSSGASNYVWDLGDGSPISTTEDVIHTYQITNGDSVTIQLIAYSVSGCSDTATLILPVNDSVSTGITIPTGLSPNNDGENDSWTVGGLENYPDAVIKVYNRWGQVLFEGDQANPTWNGYFQGNLLPTGDYYYIVDLGNDEKFNGVVTLKQ